MVVSDPKDVDGQRLLMKKNQQMLLLCDPHTSSRLTAMESGIRQTFVIRILHTSFVQKKLFKNR